MEKGQKQVNTNLADLRAQNELQKSIERVMEVPSCAALRWSIQHMSTKKASTKLAFIYLILNAIKATQPTAEKSQILRWLGFY
ncbi:hypothetical protein DLH97_17865 [Vibrio parahaemolyticus]|nr:hypothetical protein [Vibrio parahaemolyticus]EGR2874032.1 hypothetical protein [Vibrio parahaemolyticus]